MKHYLLSVGLLLCTGASIAQSAQLNKEKYWKFRNTFKERFIKIGPADGESLPACAVVPAVCTDTYDVAQDGTPWRITEYGEMHWGDGTIRQGHYLVLLATEYRLLKNSGQNEQAQATLNELYYALHAFFRLDQFAEAHQSQAQGISPDVQNMVNGFYNREDIGKHFATDNWLTARGSYGCVNSAYSTSNNINNINEPDSSLLYKGNSYQNVPSADQLSSMLVGLAMVTRLVDPVMVQPTPQDPAINLVDWAKGMVHYMIDYAAKNDWFILDVNGWPVNNGGGDLLLQAAPLIEIYHRFNGGSLLNENCYRRLLPYKKVQAYVTGFDTNEPSDDTWDSLNVAEHVLYHEIFDLFYNCYLGISDQFQNSNFLRWQYCGNHLDANSIVLRNFWHDYIPNNVAAMVLDWQDDQKLNNVFGMNGTLFDEILGSIVWDELPLKNNNNTILFNLGVLSGWWDQAICNEWGDATGNRQLELINCILNGFPPAEDSAFYGSYLDSLGFEGSYNLSGWGTDQAGEPIIKRKFQNGGWGGEYRWTSLPQSQGIGGEDGIYNNLDYMVYYNLLQLQFGPQGPNPGAYSETWTCNCGADVAASGPVNQPGDSAAYYRLNQKLNYVDVCQENVFYSTNNMVTTVFNIQPRFSNYIPLGIYTTKYQTENASVLPGGDINVETRFVVCNGTLNVQAGGRIDVERKEMIVNTNGVVDNSGEILVRVGTQLALKSGSKLTLRSGSKLTIEDGATFSIEPGATLEYYDGAEIILLGAGSEIEHGGTIRAMDSTTFAITAGGTGSQKGKYTITSFGAAFLADEASYFVLAGKSINDPFLQIATGARLYVQDPEIVSFVVENCTIDVQQDASIRAEQPFYAYHLNCNSGFSNGGVAVTDANLFLDCHFNHVPVKGLMDIENVSPFSATDCSFTASSTTLNPLDPALLRISGMGIHLTNCAFFANRTYCIQSQSLTLASNITGCSFTKNGEASGSTMTGISDVSNVEMRVVSSNFQKCQHGINKSSGKLSLKCNVFTNNDYRNITVQNGCLLNMSTGDLAGYNVLNKTLQNRNIAFTHSPVNLKEGYNFIEQCTYTVTGTTSTNCSGAGCTLNFANNQWNAANSVPAASLFQLGSANGNYITPLVATVAVKPACGYYDGGPIVIGPPKGKSTLDPDGMPIIWSAMENDSIRLDDAIVSGMEAMTVFDSSGNDLAAVERFNELYTSDADLSAELTRNLLWFALGHMKSALENAFTKNQLTQAQNVTDFEPHAAMYANALMKMTAGEIDEDNYETQFYNEIDKAHLFRVIGHSDIGLNMLAELEACGLDSAEQANLNHWKTVFSGDLINQEMGLAVLDTVIAIDTNGFINPALSVNAFAFGAQIIDLNDITYPNCHFFYKDKRLQNEGLIVFPNPATGEATIQWFYDPGEGAGTITILQADGRQVFSRMAGTGQTTELSVDVSNWNTGMYLVRFTRPDGKSASARLVVK